MNALEFECLGIYLLPVNLHAKWGSWIREVDSNIILKTELPPSQRWKWKWWETWERLMKHTNDNNKEEELESTIRKMRRSKRFKEANKCEQENRRENYYKSRILLYTLCEKFSLNLREWCGWQWQAFILWLIFLTAAFLICSSSFRLVNCTSVACVLTLEYLISYRRYTWPHIQSTDLGLAILA